MIDTFAHFVYNYFVFRRKTVAIQLQVQDSLAFIALI